MLTSRSRSSILPLAIACTFFAGPFGLSGESEKKADQRTSGKRAWVTQSWEDFEAGTFSDGGVNMYAAADGTLRLINLWDLNGDGNIELLLPNSHGSNSKPDLYIYWGHDEWSEDSRTRLPANGAKSAAVADFNLDGWPDLVVANRSNGIRNDLDSFIYWGSKTGMSQERLTRLPAVGPEAVAAADLNGDGFPEIVIANNGMGYHVAEDSFHRSFIYWNREGAFSPQDRTELETSNAQGVAVGDFNQDGKLDIAFANKGNEEGEAGIFIYLAQLRGEFADQPSIHLPGERSSALVAHDLNGDGWLDLALANAFRLKDREGGIYDIVDTVALDSPVYWGGPDGFSEERATLLPTVSPTAVDAGDLNGDGWPDLVFAQTAGGHSFVYWGSPQGPARNRRLQIPGAHSATRIADLDGDGRNDLMLSTNVVSGSSDAPTTIYLGRDDGLSLSDTLVVPSSHAGGLVAADLDLDGKKDLVVINISSGGGIGAPAYIYWGEPDGRFSPSNLTLLPGTQGSGSNAAADFNADGHVDILIAQNPPIIFWGGEKGFSEERSEALPSEPGFSGRTADFNRDGYLDLAMSEWEPGSDSTHLYWGGPGGYSKANSQTFPIGGVRYHTIADLNQDGWVDLLYPNSSDQYVAIFWNGPNGFAPVKETRLPARATVVIEVADLNGDGFLDVIVPNMYDKNPAPGKTRAFGGSPEGDTFIYWGGPEGPDPGNRTVLPSIGVHDAAVADLNRDGHLDLVLTSYHAGVTRSHPSYIYWNSAEGFDTRRVTMLPTHSAAGVLVADFDRDDWPDIFFANHTRDGNHTNESWLYWGSADGFSQTRRLSLPGLGPHNLTVTDIGHIADRSDIWTYTSQPYYAGSGSRFTRLEWEADTPHRTRVAFQVRAASDSEALGDAPWTGPKGPDSFWDTSGARLPGSLSPNAWVQYRIRLISPNSANSPIVRSVTLYHR